MDTKTQTGAAPDMATMGELIPITDVKVGAGIVPTCNARELHAYLQVRKDFSSWIKGRIAKYGFAESADYATEVFPNLGENLPSRGGRPNVEYHLTLDMAKELAMVENNPMGRQVRRYFIECEKRAHAGVVATVTAPVPTDPGWAEWLSLSTDERRTRQKDIIIDKQLYGSSGGRYTAYQVGRPIPPKWVLSASQQHELELARAGQGVTVMVNVPTNGRSH